MFNQYLEMSKENADVIFTNSVIENLKFVIVSLDMIFKGEVNGDYYFEDYTFYFYHLQNALTSCGNINNVFSDTVKRYRKYESISSTRACRLRHAFNVDITQYRCLFDKRFRNANAHFDERYDLFDGIVGDYNTIGRRTPESIKNEIYKEPHIRTLDTENWIYYTYDSKRKRIALNLKELRNEAYDLLYKISNHECMISSKLTHIPTKEII